MRRQQILWFRTFLFAIKKRQSEGIPMSRPIIIPFADELYSMILYPYCWPSRRNINQYPIPYSISPGLVGFIYRYLQMIMMIIVFKSLWMMLLPKYDLQIWEKRFNSVGTISREKFPSYHKHIPWTYSKLLKQYPTWSYIIYS